MKRILVVLFCFLSISSLLFATEGEENVVVEVEQAIVEEEVSTAKTEQVQEESMEKKSDWFVGNYVDDFGDETGKKFLTTGYKLGTFSNSATTDDRLLWRLMIDESSVAIELLEYGSYLVRAVNKEEYSIKVKDEDNEICTFYGYNFSDRVRIGYSDIEPFLHLFATKNNLRIILAGEYYSSYKLGTISTEGFKELYYETFGKDISVLAETEEEGDSPSEEDTIVNIKEMVKYPTFSVGLDYLGIHYDAGIYKAPIIQMNIYSYLFFNSNFGITLDLSAITFKIGNDSSFDCSFDAVYEHFIEAMNIDFQVGAGLSYLYTKWDETFGLNLNAFVGLCSGNGMSRIIYRISMPLTNRDFNIGHYFSLGLGYTF